MKPSLEKAVAGARQPCERVGLTTGNALTDSGRNVVVLKGLNPETRRNLFAPVLAEGVEQRGSGLPRIFPGSLKSTLEILAYGLAVQASLVGDGENAEALAV